ncbi:MAG: O-antigen ligase family protein, partial [Solirubrobacteraceae bacterium]
MTAVTSPADPRAARVLLVAFAACLLYACFAGGATALPQERWLQLGLAVVATGAIATWLYGGGLRLRAAPAGWVGLALLVLFAVWAGVSIAWSVAPDRSWAEVNRVLAFALTVLIGMILGSSLPRAAERVGVALALVSLPVALYALGGKTLPGVHVGSLVDLDQTAGFNRLRAPLGYWNALALACVSGLLPMLRFAADPSRRTPRRVAALVGVFVLVLVIGLTYSRGGVLAMIAGVATLTAFGTERVRTLALFVSALVASAVPLAVALSRPDLTTDLVPLARREDDALAVLVAVLVVGALLAVWGRRLIALEGGSTSTPARGRALGRPVAAVLAVVVVLGIAGSALSGSAARAFDGFKNPKNAAGLTDPNRLLSANSGNRWLWWQEAAGAWSDKPAAGWGAGSFPVTHKLYRQLPLSVLQPHNVPLQWLAEDGLIGFALAAVGLLALLAAALARVRAAPWA